MGPKRLIQDINDLSYTEILGRVYIAAEWLPKAAEDLSPVGAAGCYIVEVSLGIEIWRANQNLDI